MPKLSKALQAVAGNAGAALYVEDVFSTYLYTGNSSSRSITNNIDLSTEGGLVWVKSRGVARNHHLVDTVRGASTGSSPGKTLFSNSNSAEGINNDIIGFNTDGFDLGTADPVNNLNELFTSWTFRKAPKWFDIVTWTGDGTFSKQVLHSLESSPGFIITKRTDSTTFGEWAVWHRNDGTTPKTHFRLNGTNGATNGSNQHTSTYFKPAYVEDHNGVVANQSGATYVAYLFAHNAGGFGADGTEDVISCGSYTGNGSLTGPTVNLGYEPQWLLVKSATLDGPNWFLFDNMRGVVVGNNDARLVPNNTDAESSSLNLVEFNSTGFQITYNGNAINGSGDTYIYIAIRRGPMKTPTAGTEVFAPVTYAGTGTTQNITTGFANDMEIIRRRDSAENNVLEDKLRGSEVLFTNTSSGGLASTGDVTGYLNTGFTLGASNQGSTNDSGSAPYISWNFRRAPGFFDMVAYKGNGTAGRTVAHNLGVVPELMIVKNRNASAGNGKWTVYDSSNGATNVMFLDAIDASSASSVYWNNTEPTSTVFTVGSNDYVNYTNDNYIAYLFASLDGVSKVGSVTISSSGTLNVDCGFANGARFVMLKRSSASSSWYVMDTARGIVAGNDPYIAFDKTNAENFYGANDNIDPYSAGFTIPMSTFSNLEGTGTYIFLAIA